MPPLLILIPLFGVLILNLPLKDLMRKSAFFVAFALFLAQMALAMCQHSCACGGAPMDNLSFIALLSIGIVSLTSLVVGRYTIKDTGESFNFINLLMIASIGMSGVVMASDIFTLYVYLEVTAVSAFILIALQKESHALEGAFKYIVLSSIASILMLSSIALMITVSGSTSFAAVRDALVSNHTSFIAGIAVAIFLCGLFIKGGLVPFHGWLPDAYMSAPSPVSVLLAGIVTKVSGIYTLIRLVTSIFGFTPNVKTLLLIVGTVSMLVGAFAALGQKNFKRMLAFSSISQMGYILVGLGSGSALGLAGAAFHFFNHAVFKSLLFVNAAAVERSTGKTDMDDMGGLSARMPVTGATSMVGFLSTSGIPPMAGFWSKLMIIIALWQSGNITYAVIAVLASLLTLSYMLMMQRKIFFGLLRAGFENVKEVEFGFAAISVLLAIVTIGAGIFFPVIFNNFLMQVVK